jgi:NTF2-like N-terminal transpeptidase domain
VNQEQITQKAKEIEENLQTHGISGGSGLGEQFHSMDPAERQAIAKQIQHDQGGKFDSALRWAGAGKPMPHLEFTDSGDLKSASVDKSENVGTVTYKATYDTATGKMNTYDVQTPVSEEHDKYTYDSKTGKLKTDDIEYSDYRSGKTGHTHYDYDANTGKPIQR